MTIARRQGRNVDAAVAVAPPAAPIVVPSRVGVPVPLGDAPTPESSTPVGRLRRCTFRRIDRTEALPGRSAATGFEVMCLYVDRDEPIALGDIDSARPVCGACMAPGIFRPDED